MNKGLELVNSMLEEWNEKLVLANNPANIRIATNEINRLKKIKEALIEKPDASTQAATHNRLPHDPPVVLIIHGHDQEMMRHVQVFLNRIEVKDLIWIEEPDRSRTIIEKLIEEAHRVDYVIALMSPDDQQANGSTHARQNVIMEIGFYIGRLGRDKVRLLIKGEPEIPSNLRGVLYTKYEGYAWKMDMAKEMHAVGIKLNFAGLVR